jgi:Tfp pilus assembly protein PilO
MERSAMSKPNMRNLKMNALAINAVNMKSLLRYLEVLRHQLGLLGTLGLLGLVICLVMGLTSLLPGEQALQQKTQALAWLSQQPAQSAQAQAQLPKLNDEEALKRFYAQFPPVGEVSKVLAQIHQLAQAKGISLVVGEYKLAPDANNPRLMRYEIIFPVQGSYKNLKAFIASASEQFPTLGLTEVNIKRETVKDTAVQIKLSYALLLRREP